MTFSSHLQPVTRESTSRLVAGHVRTAIAEGELAPGTKLDEAGIARDLGVSRGSVREGLQRLDQQGLVRGIHHHGLFVIELTRRDVQDIYNARALIEREAAVDAAKDYSHRGLGAIREALDDMTVAIRRGDARALSHADLGFHKALVRSSDNRRLSRMHNTLLVEAQMCLNVFEEREPTLDDRLREHAGITDAIAGGDPKLADELVKEHLSKALEELLGTGVFDVLAAMKNCPSTATKLTTDGQ